MATFFLSVTKADALEIKTIRFGVHGTSVRAVLDLSGEADFRASAQADPARVIVDMPMISGTPNVNRADLPALIKDVRLEPLGAGNSRLTFLLNGTAAIRSAFLMPATANKAARLVVDLAPVGADVFASQVGRPYGTLNAAAGAKASAPLRLAAPEGTNLQPLSKPQAPVVESPKSPDELPLVVIDAGHGGQDPGASGSEGLHEKDVTLSVARQVRSELLATGKYRVKLTRDGDVFIPLNERVRIARREGADLFVSIHADSINGDGRGARGASVYTLSDRASDEQTARLAARENQVDLLAGIQLPAEDKEVATILIDLAMRETTNQSKRFAGQLVGSFGRNGIAMLEGPHRHAGFVVLKAPDIPSVLVELGFLSNPDEVKKLADNAYRLRISKAITAGIDAWFGQRKN